MDWLYWEVTGLHPLASTEPTELSHHVGAATLRRRNPQAEPVQDSSLGSDKFTTEVLFFLSFSWSETTVEAKGMRRETRSDERTRGPL